MAAGQNCRRRPPAAPKRRRPKMSSNVPGEKLEAQGDRGVRPGANETVEVIFIDENTPTPELPQRKPYVPVSRRRQDGDDALYIGPE